jgi:hypothetical protein
MNKGFIVVLLSIVLLISFSIPCFAGWLIYHKPEFRGKVIDAETKEPIEEAAVVVTYSKHSIIGGPAGGYSSIIHTKEALTDNDGGFRIPSYTTVMGPNSIEDEAEFIIFKPGYGNFRNRVSPPIGISLPGKERFFLAENFEKQGDIDIIAVSPQDNRKVKVTFGVVELPKVHTREERRKELPGYPNAVTLENSPLFFNILNEEYKKLGLELAE